ncbi:unnamed protein product [Paramecium sonneborni]|uniref:C3H1-type domain-containing protein n=1 Tax=Paramecium sonneborni TaxID=65129 RepID=A0A8S1MFA7_9CILI|nr:unnamed protein product [Paramecium sonneborni]
MQNQKLCLFFLKNKCNKGDQCSYKHDIAEAEKIQKGIQQQRHRIPDGYKQQNYQSDDQTKSSQNQFRFDGLQQRKQQNNINNNSFTRDRQQNDNQFRKFNDNQGGQFKNNQERQFNNNQGRQFNNNQGRQFNNNQGRQFNNDQGRQFNNDQGRQFNENQVREHYQGRDQNMRQNNDGDSQNDRQFNEENNQRRRQNQQQENQMAQPNRFQQNNQHFQQKQDFRQQNPRQNQNEFKNNARQLECEHKIFTQIQTFEITEFVQSIYIEQFQVLGVAKKNALIFYKVNEQVNLNNKTQIQLPENICSIYQIWSQVIDNQLVLIISYQTKKISLRNIAIYPNLWQSYQHYTILDVSIKEIVHCRIQGNLCLVFSNDGTLRVYVIQNTTILFPPRIYNFENPIESVLSIPKSNNDETYYIGFQNGQLLSFQNGQFIQIPHELNNQKFALVDMKYDLNNQQLFLLFWHLEEDLSQIIVLNLNTMITVLIFKQNVKISQIEILRDFILCSNSLGIVDILKFDQNMQLSPFSYYPHQIEQSKSYNKIQSLNKITLKNQNQVEIQLLLLGRTCSGNQTQNNIELLCFN